MISFKCFLVTFTLASVMLLGSCSKTEDDLSNEAKVIGVWKNELKFAGFRDTIIYCFQEGYSGYTKKFDDQDLFTWEVKRGYVRTYYKKSPPYSIGQDKFNSKGLYRINYIEDNTMELVQLLYNGYQTTVLLQRQ